MLTDRLLCYLPGVMVKSRVSIHGKVINLYKLGNFRKDC